MANPIAITGRCFMGRQIIIWSVVCILLVSLGLSAGTEKVTLELHLKTGQTFNLLHVTESDISAVAMGQEMNRTQTHRIGYTFEIREVGDDGTATCKVTYKFVQMIMSSNGDREEYNSDKPPATVPESAKLMAALVGQSLSLRVSPAGRVLEVQGGETLYAKVMKEWGVANESMRATIEQQLRERFGTDAIRETMELAIGAYFPDKPVDIGDSWIKPMRTTLPYPMSVANTCTLKDRKAGLAVIDVAGKISTNPAAKLVQFGPMSVAFQVSGERKGQVEIEEATGWTACARFVEQISGVFKASGGPAEDMSIPFSGKITTHIESKK
jgi:hypothetical protein